MEVITVEDKKRAAAIAAVMAYIKEEEETISPENQMVSIPYPLYVQMNQLYQYLRTIFE